MILANHAIEKYFRIYILFLMKFKTAVHQQALTVYGIWLLVKTALEGVGFKKHLQHFTCEAWGLCHSDLGSC